LTFFFFFLSIARSSHAASSSVFLGLTTEFTAFPALLRGANSDAGVPDDAEDDDGCGVSEWPPGAELKTPEELPFFVGCRRGHICCSKIKMTLIGWYLTYRRFHCS
jgi:hypothetical protein